MQPAIFLDRDGVLNEVTLKAGKPHPPQTLAELVILPGVEDALKKLHQAGYLLMVVTNQPDVVRGAQSKQVIEAMHDYLKQCLPLDAIYTCYHDDHEHCDCRKPLPGLLQQAAEEWSIDLSQSWMVGDRWRDIEAGQRAGCRTVFIDYGYAEKQPEQSTVKAVSLSAWVKEFI